MYGMNSGGSGSYGSKTAGKASHCNNIAKDPRISKADAVASRAKSKNEFQGSGKKQWTYSEVEFGNPSANIKGI